MRRGSAFRDGHGRRLPQTMRRAMRQFGFIAPIPEPIAEASDTKGAPKLGRQERHIADRVGGVDDGLKLGDNWKLQAHWLAPGILHGREPCWRPSPTTSLRRTPSHISKHNARRALLPIG